MHRNPFLNDPPYHYRNPAPLDGVTTFMMDVDGVITTGTVWCGANGEKYRSIYSKDSYALQLAVKMGYRVCVISGGSAVGVRERLETLGITDIFTGAEDKLPVFEAYCKKHSLEYEQIMYIGDDIPDLQILHRVGVAVAPADAGEDVMNAVHFVTKQAGGQGAIREALEKVMKIQQKWYTPSALKW